jgi:superfamily II DNA or RNA helicase
MAKSDSRKKGAKNREQRRKEFRRHSADQARKEKAEFYFEGALYYMELENFEKAETFLKKAIKRDPDSRDALFELARLGSRLEKYEMVRDGLIQLYERGLLENTPEENDLILVACRNLIYFGEFRRARQTAEDVLAQLDALHVQKPKQFGKRLQEIIAYASAMPDSEQTQNGQRSAPRPAKGKSRPAAPAGKAAGKSNVRNKPAEKRKSPLPDDLAEPAEAAAAAPTAAQPGPDIEVRLEIKENAMAEALSRAHPAAPEEYDLVLSALRLRFKETFDQLLCLNTLTDITSLSYQEETARKILKKFRGRALLADEVGMGKTIEACMVLKEYLMRRMIENVLILAPTPLVSQWQQELASKFSLDFRSTDDPDFRAMGESFWQQSRIVASVNIAKSKKNFSAVAGREWDMVIADEAHHFKNRTTLNWKLLNSLKKRFLLMLTATPVENNLMELYNLITLLKPGQLKTASAFKEEFMTRGDPTDPKNRTLLKGLLDQVMIRNTRAVANIQIPPRFAETISTTPTSPEIELYSRVIGLVQEIHTSAGARSRMIPKHLLAEAGSSPAAVIGTLSRLTGNAELPALQVEEIRSIRSLARSMDDTGKNKLTLQLIQEADDKVLLFVKYRATLDHLSEVLHRHKISHSLFHGQMPNAEKDRQIERFRTENNVLLTTELGGEGRNLQFCRRMINYDLPWNPMRIEQRIGRIHRIGQTREVFIHNLCAAGTVEEYILDILDRKINMFEMVIGEIDMIIGRMRGEQDFADLAYDLYVNAASDEERKEAFDKLGTRLKRCRTGYEKTKDLDEKLFGENYEI